MTHSLDAGDAAPDFTLPATRGKTASLDAYAGKVLILFFYPKDDTEVCTREAVAFSDMQSRFARKGAALLGVSRDSLADHKAFTAKYKLKVNLGSDGDGEVCNAFGVWQRETALWTQVHGYRPVDLRDRAGRRDSPGVAKRPCTGPCRSSLRVSGKRPLTNIRL